MDQTSLPSHGSQRPALHPRPNDSMQASPSASMPLPYGPSPSPGMTDIWTRQPQQPPAGPLPVNFLQGQQHTFPRLHTNVGSVHPSLSDGSSALPPPGRSLPPHSRSRQSMPQWNSILQHPMPAMLDSLSVNSLNNSNASVMVASNAATISAATSAAMLSSRAPGRDNARTSETTLQPPATSDWTSANATIDASAHSASPLHFLAASRTLQDSNCSYRAAHPTQTFLISRPKHLFTIQGKDHQQQLPLCKDLGPVSRKSQAHVTFSCSPLCRLPVHPTPPVHLYSTSFANLLRVGTFAVPSSDGSGPFAPAPERRRQAQSRGTRRSSISSRQPVSDPVPSQESSTQQPFRPITSIRQYWGASREARLMRQLQSVRGGMERKMVASKAALQSLESVPIDTLKDNEKSMLVPNPAGAVCAIH